MSNYSKSTSHVQKLTIMAMLCAIAYVCTFLLHNIPIMPSAPYLSIDPKDAIIAIGGFIFGPIEAIIMTVVVCLIEMVTISSTGFIGLVMNILSTGIFVTAATLLYSRKPKFRNAVIGLVIGTILMSGMMVLWNYLITPLYTGMDRALIAPMLPTVFLPFNLLKGCINSAITLFLYKAVVIALQKSKLLPEAEKSENGDTKKKSITPMVMIASLVVLATCVLIILVINGKI